MLVGTISTLVACDSKEHPFVISNTLPQAVTLQILEFGIDTDQLPPSPALIGREGEYVSGSLRLAAGEVAEIYKAGVAEGRKGYIIVINDERGNELFRQEFPRDDLIKHNFKLTITGQGIEYSP